jgi:hypothetical protein
MAMLVKEIVDLEAEAESILAEARAEEQNLEKSVDKEIATYRERLAEELNRKLSAFQKETAERHTSLTAQAESELKEALNDLDNIPGETLRRQVERIVARFRGL